MHILKKLLLLLTPHERKHLGLLLIMIIIMAFLDMIGIASILPFMAVLANPTLIETNSILNTMFQVSNIFGVESNKQFLFALGVLVFVLLITSLAFKALTTYVQVRFVQMREYSIGKRLVEGYLHQPYSWFLSRNSAELGKDILSEVQQLISTGISPSLELIAKGAVTITIIILLIIADPKLTLIVGLSLGGSYGMIFYILRKYLNQIGKKRLINNQLRFKSVTEAFGATKEIKVGGLEQIFVNLFSNAAQNYAQTQASVRVVAQLPRFILEAIAFGGILLLILYSMNNLGSFNNALPIISLFIFAGYRLLPALQSIYSCLIQITYIGPSIDKIYNDIKNNKSFNENQDEDVLDLNKNIILKNIHYNYPNSSKTVLKDINLSIPSKSTVGLIGTTGSGKTTMVDIILGLLDPQKGFLEIDGKIITKQNLRSWQRSIGYVPQHIYLTDDTVEANIAFGASSENIKKDLVEKAAKIASLHEFVVNELPKKYQTIIGERGIRLSGGQRQRIGIARALYHNPKVLILDEATSALDNQTEQAVMEAVNNLSNNITIIMIAHRLDTVKNCDIIFKIDKGQVVEQGDFNKIIHRKNYI
jgi:ABC-type multidrug transport system fused ATPase/permease subunit